MCGPEGVVLATSAHLTFQTLQLSSLYREPSPLQDILEAARGAGYRAVGLDIYNVGAWCREGGSIDHLAALLASMDLSCTDVSPLVISPDARQTIEACRDLARLAGATSAKSCVVAFGPDLASASDPEAVAALNSCADILGRVGVKVALEYLPYSPLNTVDEAIGLCERLGWERAGLCVDTWHTEIGEQMTAFRELRAEQIALVQVSDAKLPLGATVIESSRRRRRMPGLGDLRLVEMLGHLAAVGFSGPITTEVLQSATTPVDAFARQSFTAMQDLLAQVPSWRSTGSRATGGLELPECSETEPHV